jgi:transcriptional regulator with XRE-family HTH domain
MLQGRRKKAGLTQRQLAALLDKPQSWVCRHERGDLRMDYMELRAYLQALDVSVVSFVSALERKLAKIEEE